MKNTLLMGAAALAAVGTLGHFGAKPLLAQIRAALVKNIDERGRSPYIVQVPCQPGSDLGGPINKCTWTFPPVPPNKRLVVEYVNAAIDGANGGFAFNAYLQVPSAGSQLIALTSHFEVSRPAFAGILHDYYSISMPVMLYYEAGQVPVAVALEQFSGHFMNGPFTLSGYLIDLTQ